MAPEDQVAAEVNKDPFTSRLKPIVSDNKTKGGMPAWVTKSYNMDTDMIDPKTGLATINHGTVVVKASGGRVSMPFTQAEELSISIVETARKPKITTLRSTHGDEFDKNTEGKDMDHRERRKQILVDSLNQIVKNQRADEQLWQQEQAQIEQAINNSLTQSGSTPQVDTGSALQIGDFHEGLESEAPKAPEGTMWKKINHRRHRLQSKNDAKSA